MKLLCCLFVLAMAFAYMQAQDDSATGDSPPDDSGVNDTSIGIQDFFGYRDYYVSCNGNRHNLSTNSPSPSCWDCKGNLLCLKRYTDTACAICGGDRTCIPSNINNVEQCFQCNSKRVCFGSGEP